MPPKLFVGVDLQNYDSAVDLFICVVNRNENFIISVQMQNQLRRASVFLWHVVEDTTKLGFIYISWYGTSFAVH